MTAAQFEDAEGRALVEAIHQTEGRSRHGPDDDPAHPPPHGQGTRMSGCHECYCHLAPPCGQCVECKHVDITDCDNDCQDCEDHNDE